jgi:hypothetical protein
MTTSNEKAELPKVKQQGLRMDVVCDRDCRDNLGMGVMAMLFFSVGVILMLWQLKKRYSEKPSAQKDFVILMVLWFGITFILFTPIAYDFAPRFFLLIAALPFVFLGNFHFGSNFSSVGQSAGSDGTFFRIGQSQDGEF